MIFHPLSEGSFTIDQTKEFVPFDTERDQLQERPTGSLLVEIQPFVVKTATDLLLLDTGLGFSVDGELQIHRNLRALGYAPEEVTKVLLSHLHKDHAGGIAYGEGADRKLSFPQATYYLSAQELQFAFEKGMPSYPADELQILVDHTQVRFVSDGDRIDGSIQVMHSGGHCPHHQVFLIREGEQVLFFGGDEAPQLQQMKHRFVAKYDHDGKKAQQLRQQWWEQGAKEHWTMLFYHDIRQPHWSC
jgi:glyoxylase-like metal-dependent hydrolase (beta-lactamase superfamily II)